MVLKTCLESFKVIAEQTQEKILIVIENCDWKLWLKIVIENCLHNICIFYNGIKSSW